MNDQNNQNSENNGRSSGLLSKLTHGFAPSILHGCDCQPGYGEARGVSIRVENLMKSFAGNPVLKGINLEIKADTTAADPQRGVLVGVVGDAHHSER